MSKPEKTLSKIKDLKGIAALKMAQDQNPRGVLQSGDAVEGTRLSKGHMKKLVRRGWLCSTYITDDKGARKLAFYVNPELRIAGNL